MGQNARDSNNVAGSMDVHVLETFPLPLPVAEMCKFNREYSDWIVINFGNNLSSFLMLDKPLNSNL